MALQGYTLGKKRLTAMILTSIAIMVLLLQTGAYYAYGAMYGVIHSYSGNYDWRKVYGSLYTPYPSLGTYSHKDYIVYMSNTLSGVGVGSGINVFRQGTSTTYTCFVMYVDETVNQNRHFVDCTVSFPSTTPNSISIEQTSNDGKTYKAKLGTYQQTYTFSADGATTLPNYGAAAGGTTDNLSMYSHFDNLRVLRWNGNDYSFDSSPAIAANLIKCYVDSGYKYDKVNGAESEILTGPPSVNGDDCVDVSDEWRPGSEWD